MREPNPGAPTLPIASPPTPRPAVHLAAATGGDNPDLTLLLAVPAAALLLPLLALPFLGRRRL